MAKSAVSGAILSVALMVGSSARAAENNAEREARDRAQIEKLMWQGERGQRA